MCLMNQKDHAIILSKKYSYWVLKPITDTRYWKYSNVENDTWSVLGAAI